MKILSSLLVAVAVVACALTEAGHLPHPHVFPARLRNTPLYRQSVREEHDYSRSIGHQTNSSVNWINMPLYHSGESGEQTFRNRMYYDTSFWNKEQPIGNVGIFYASGEGPSTRTPGGFLLDVANMTGALIINCENRWYGESLPGALTDTDLFMKTLHVDLVLEDANFCMTAAENMLNGGQAMKWYVVGGSYSGAISSWMRAKYPERLIWSWSSSGVVHPVFDFSDFDGHVKKVLPRECFDAIKTGFDQFSDLWDADKDAVLTLLGGTPSFFTKEDAAWMLSDGTAMQVQYGGKTALCDIMTNRQVQPEQTIANSGNDMLLRMKASIVHFFGPQWLVSLDSNCYYSTECLSNAQYSAHWGPAGYSWVRQCCGDDKNRGFGWWNIAGAQKESLRPRILTTDYFMAQCRSMLKRPTLFPDVYTINTNNGGDWPYSLATKVVALQGSADPWQTVGVRQSFPDKEYFYKEAYCPNCGHCGDLSSPGPNDLPTQLAQREFIKKYARQWMGMPPAPTVQPPLVNTDNSNKHAFKQHRVLEKLMEQKK